MKNITTVLSLLFSVVSMSTVAAVAMNNPDICILKKCENVTVSEPMTVDTVDTEAPVAGKKTPVSFSPVAVIKTPSDVRAMILAKRTTFIAETREYMKDTYRNKLAEGMAPLMPEYTQGLIPFSDPRLIQYNAIKQEAQADLGKRIKDTATSFCDLNPEIDEGNRAYCNEAFDMVKLKIEINPVLL